MRYVWIFILLSVLSTLAASLTYAFAPLYRYLLLREDSLVENITAALFLCAMLISALALCMRSVKGTRGTFILIGSLALLGALEELSFGERIFDLSMPLLLGHKIDSAHDVVDLANRVFRWDMKNLGFPPYILHVAVALICVAAILRYRKRIWTSLCRRRADAPYILALCSAAFILAAAIIDLDIVLSGVLSMLEELFEMLCALALMLCAASLLHVRVIQGRLQRPALVNPTEL